MADLAGFTWPDDKVADVFSPGESYIPSCHPTTMLIPYSGYLGDAATPHSTESEQSAALDPPVEDDNDDFEFFELDKAAISNESTNLPTYQQAVVPDSHLAFDPTILSTFGSAFSHFGELDNIGADASTQLGLTGLFAQSETPLFSNLPTAVANSQPGPEQFYESLFGALPATVEPSALISPPLNEPSLKPGESSSLKRKLSDASTESTPAVKRPRGRPPKSRSSIDSPLRRPSKRSKLDTPGSLSISLVADSEPSSTKVTTSGKASTARPKSVVPERYLRDGTAQRTLGMDSEQIAKYPTFEDLLKDVEPSKQAAAAELGAKIADQRDKAADAAKKSRDERRAKIDTLEQKVSDLTRLLSSIASRGGLSSSESAMLVALAADD